MIRRDRLVRLTEDLSHPDAARRRLAARDLGRSDERALYPLIRTLRDENPGVQDAAMRSLIAIGGEVTAYMLTPLLREGPCLRNTAAVIIREIGTQALPAVYPLLADRDADVRNFGIGLLADIGEGVEPRHVLRLMTDPNPNVRASAVRAAGRLCLRDATPLLIGALGDVEWVCFSALESLGELKDPAAVPAVAAMLSAPSEPLRHASLDALGKIASDTAKQVLMDYVESAEAAEKASALINLINLGMTPSFPGAAELLARILEDGDWNDKIVAVRGLAAIGARESAPLIADMAGGLDPSDPRCEELLALIRDSLAGFGSPGIFIDIVNDPGMRYRGKVLAIGVLEVMRAVEALPHLRRLSRTDIRDIRQACKRAICAIEKEGPQKAVKPEEWE